MPLRLSVRKDPRSTKPLGCSSLRRQRLQPNTALTQDVYAVQAYEHDQEELSDLHFIIEQEQQWSAGAEARRAQTELSLRDAELNIEFLEAELASVAQRQAGQHSEFLLQLAGVTKVHTHIVQ